MNDNTVRGIASHFVEILTLLLRVCSCFKGQKEKVRFRYNQEKCIYDSGKNRKLEQKAKLS